MIYAHRNVLNMYVTWKENETALSYLGDICLELDRLAGTLY